MSLVHSASSLFLCHWVWWSITARRDWNYQKGWKNRVKLEEERRMAHRAANALNCLSPSGTLHSGWKCQSKPIVRWHIGVLHMKHIFIPLRSPEWHQWRQKGIAATEAAVVCVNSGSPLTVPHNLCERPCRRSFSKTARVFFRTAIVEMLFTELTIFRIFKASTWNSTLRPLSTWHCSLSFSLRSQSAWSWYMRWNTQCKLTYHLAEVWQPRLLFCPAAHQRADVVIARTSVLTQRAKGVNVWVNFETKHIGAGPKGQSDGQWRLDLQQVEVGT